MSMIRGEEEDVMVKMESDDTKFRKYIPKNIDDVHFPQLPSDDEERKSVNSFRSEKQNKLEEVSSYRSGRNSRNV
jgi:hypothetical protein